MVGPNGVGKSNLLEAVELLGSLRSHRSNSDKDLVHWNQKNAIVRAKTSNDDTIALEFCKGVGRRAIRNGKNLSRQVDLLGSLRCVGFSALDLTLVRGEPALRRSWLDRVVQQLEPIYGDLMTRFSRLLRQRNQLWRQLINSSKADHDVLLDTFDAQMALVSTRIHRRRNRALKLLQPLASTWQQRLSNGKEGLELEYLPGSILQGEEDERTWRLLIEKQLFDQRADEERLGVCKVGPHRDELVFLLNGVQARKFASAGQQRTLVLSLKLAELELVGKMYKDPPVLVLDDVFAELDPTRQLLLLEAVGDDHQCLISSTHLDAFEGNWRKDSQILELELLKDGVLEVS